MSPTSVSISRALLIFYIYSLDTPLVNKHLTQYLETSKSAQYIFAFIQIFLSICVLFEIYQFTTLLWYTSITYVLFLLSTKIDLQWILILFGVLMMFFIYENELIVKQHQIVDDEILSEYEKNKIKAKNEMYENYMSCAIVVIILVGMFLYRDRKIEQHGGNYQEKLFFFS